ncbi:hypothetical protein OVY29_05330 [Sphingopyxis sp. SE2]|uniref:hypothetical protein n=1 Tax=Sphingopyxis sp. SE2 TaxID=1586240 RepID=UPI0028C2569B|nr:hypothetical protein [Sphingopyxis sp. SE2]MDT7528079.1 hypothetical protein [Sphingopyxis sp. SE2]
MSDEGLQRGADTDLGGTMRLPAPMKRSCRRTAVSVHGANDISESATVIVTVNGAYREQFEKGGLPFGHVARRHVAGNR